MCQFLYFFTFEQPEFWTKIVLLIPLINPRGSKFWKVEFIFELDMVKLGWVVIFMRFEQSLLFFQFLDWNLDF